MGGRLTPKTTTEWGGCDEVYHDRRINYRHPLLLYRPNTLMGPEEVAEIWMLRHPAHMQLIAGMLDPDRLTDTGKAADVTLTRSEWYEIYRAAGHCLP